MSPWQQGYCVLDSGFDQNAYVYRLQVNPSLPLEEFLATCLSECANVIGNTGCEVNSYGTEHLCDAHTDAIDRGNGGANVFCYPATQPVEECKGSNFEIYIDLDSSPTETSWSLRLNSTIINSTSAGYYTSQHTSSRSVYHRICLENYGDYNWRIYDSNGNGLRRGWYEIRLNGNITGSARGNFGSFDEYTFDIYETSSPTSTPSISLQPSSGPSG